MSPGTALLDRLLDLGFEVAIGDHDVLIVRPGSSLTEDLRQAIRDHRAELTAALIDPDPRDTCIRCSHYRPSGHRCINHRRALLATDAISPDLAALKQHCHGYTPIHRTTP